MKLTKFATGSIRGFSKLKLHSPVELKIGEYFWADPSIVVQNPWDISWVNLDYWWTDPEHTIQAEYLPTSATAVTFIATSLAPYVTASSWTQPLSVNAGYTNITFWSNTPVSVTCPLSFMGQASATFTGYATYGTPP